MKTTELNDAAAPRAVAPAQDTRQQAAASAARDGGLPDRETRALREGVEAWIEADATRMPVVDNAQVRAIRSFLATSLVWHNEGRACTRKS